MRHEHWNGHMREDVAGGASEHKLAQPGVAVGAHDDEIGAIALRELEDSGTRIGGCDVGCVAGDPVTHQRVTQGGA